MFASVFLVLSSSLPMFILFSSCVSSLPALFVLVSLGVLVSCCGCVVGFSFSLADYTQKERARRVGASSLRLLWVCLVVQILVTLSKNSVAVALARSNSFGW